MKRVSLLKLLAVGALLTGLGFGVVSCDGGGDGGGRAGGGFPRSETLYVGGSQWGDPTTFNPIVEPWLLSWPVNDRFTLMYESLISYNTLDGSFEPGLGTLVSRDVDRVVVDLNPAAKWSDGVRVTSADVRFVFLLGQRFPSAASAFALQFISDVQVEELSDGTERLAFVINKDDRNNPLVVLDLLQAIRIPPAHIFEQLLAEHNNDLRAVQALKLDHSPVISGPYNIEHHNSERIVLKRRDDYWGNDALHGGNMPKPRFIIHPIYKNNDHFATALQQGNLDISQTFVPRIWLRKRDGVHTWFDEAPYHLPGTILFLVINTTKPPLNDVNFRRAMAAAINYTDIKELAVSGYAPEMQPGAIMSHRLEAKYFSQEDADKYGVRYDPEEAKRILAEAGYQSIFRPDGTLDHMLDKDGNRLPTLSIMVPAGWSDFEAAVKIAEKGLRTAGIDARESPVDGGVYWPARPSGNFDILISKIAENVTPSLPWSRFEALMSSRNWAPVGGETPMQENFGRYNNPNSPEYNPRVGQLLGSVPTMTNDDDVRAAYHELNRIFMQDQPAIPLVTIPEQLYQFSDRNWKNWPTSANPYAPPNVPWVGVNTKVLWNLESAR
ncbi:MAG: ABC transporter substrate-binding protein [Chitinispirillales bacterium]|jgi:peptide/nickel transport system substrate-binding protein|nr:ABC transporter substrate-binding protein [Chitinispirillales bacterium]